MVKYDFIFQLPVEVALLTQPVYFGGAQRTEQDRNRIWCIFGG